MQPNTQDGKTKVKLMLRILEKIHVGSETNRIRILSQLKSRIRIQNWNKSFRIHNTVAQNSIFCKNYLDYIAEKAEF
jgi:alpha-glucuronidase